jgi:hypothetical protein
VQGCVLRPLCAPRPAEATLIKETTEERSRRSTSGVVGLAGLEPAASSLSAIEGSPLCNPAFLQVARDRKGRSNALFADVVSSAGR